MRSRQFTSPEVIARSASRFEDFVLGAGITVLHCDSSGKLLDDRRTNSSWLKQLLVSSPLLQRALVSNCKNWGTQDGMNITEAFPGVWFVPTKGYREKYNDYAVGVIVTEELLEGEYLRALCQASNVDFELINSMIRSLPLIVSKDVYQFGTLFIHAWELHIGRSFDFEIIESVGQELADSYEEINLLYTITGSMNSVSYPDRFFELVCNELLKTISYNWIGIHLDNMDKFSRLGNDLYVVGHLSQSISHTTKQLRILSRDLTTSSSIISDGEDTVCSNFGPGTIIVPIVSSNRVIGVLVAGNKQGSDSMASSVDIKLLSASASQLAIFLENASLYEDLNATFIGTLEALSSAIDAKDRYTCGHSKRVALLTADLARAAGLEKEQVDRFQICGIVHDIGKIGVPESVLLKDGKLTDEEFDKIRMHPEIGARILRDIPNLEDIIEGVLHHHERFDGNGYPHGIAGTKIPLVARMIAIADTFDAMSSNRTYRPAMAHEDVLIELKRVMGTQFDPELVALFLELDFSKWDELVDEQQANAHTNEGRKAA